jgi:hypothetical protein
LRLEQHRMQPRGRVMPGLIRQLQDQRRMVGETGDPLLMGIAEKHSLDQRRTRPGASSYDHSGSQHGMCAYDMESCLN